MLKRHLASWMAVLALLAGSVWAAESSGPQVVGGSATIQQNGGNLTVTTGSNRTIINWQSFGVPTGTTTNFIQPSSNSATLNRVLGNLPSRIDGSLLSNGRVYLINPNGIVVGPTGIIQTAGFVGSTLDLNDAQFMAGENMRFVGFSSETITNLGRIEASDGNVFLIAARVDNQGTIAAPNGTVGLIAGRDVLLTGNNQVYIQPAEGSLGGTGVENSGTIEAARAELQAQGNLYALAINNSGVVNATGAVEEGGRILLRADGGKITNTGTLTATQVNADGSTVGGEIRVLAEIVDLNGNAVLNASGQHGGGSIEIGGGFQGSGPEPKAQITFVGDNVKIFADALEVGNGGTVIVWADGRTYIGGEIYARGGVNGGDGGFVETSGKEQLYVTGNARISTAAVNGKGGLWLLDPHTVTVDDAGGATAVGAVDDFLDTPAADLAIDKDTLIAGGNIMIQANTDVVFTVDFTLTGTNTLTVRAGRDIVFNANVDVATTDGAITMTANDTGASVGNRDAGTGDIVFNSGATLSSQSGNILLSVDQTVLAGFSAGAVTLGAISTNGGSVTVTSAGGITLNGNIATDGAGAGTTAGLVSLTGPITLGAGIAIDTNASTTDANITFSGAGSTVNGANTLTLDAGTGTIAAQGNMGLGTALTSVSATGATIQLLSVRTATTQTYTGAVSLNGDLIVTTAGNGVSVSGTLTLAGNSTIQLNGSNAANDVGLAAVTGNFSLGITAGGGDVTVSGTVGAAALTTLTVSAGTISLQAVTTSAAQSYTGATTLNGTLTVNAAGAGVSISGATTLAVGGGAITLTGSNAANDVTLGTVNGGQALNITATGGDVTVGVAGGGAALASYTINTGAGTGTATITDITTAGGNIAVTSGAISIGSTLNTHNGGAAAGSVTFTGPVTLTATLTINTNASTTDNFISFSSTITGTTAGAEGLTLNAGGGNITVTGAVGATRLGTVDIVSANDVSLNAVTASNLLQQAGTGTTTLGGAQNFNTASGLNLTTSAVTINNTVTTTNGGVVTITNAGLLTIVGAADMTLDGAFTQNGAGTVSTAGDITTTNDGISFATAVTLTGNVALNSGAGAGDIGFGSSVNGAFALTVSAGTGSVTLRQTGNSAALTGLTVSGGALSLFNDIQMEGNANGNVDFSGVTGSITIAHATGITIDTDNTATGNAGTVNFGSASVVGSGKTLTINTVRDTAGSSGTITIGAIGTSGAPLASLSLLANGAGALTLNGSIFVDGTNLDFTTVGTTVTMNGNITLDTNDAAGAAGNVNFTGRAITGSGSLTIDTSGGTAGDVTLVSVNLTGGTGGLTVIGDQLTFEDSTPTNVATNGGAVDVSGMASVVFNDDSMTIDTDSDAAGTAGAINFGALAINNASMALTLDAGSTTNGDVTAGAIGSTTELASLTVTGRNVSLGSIGAGSSGVSGATVVTATNQLTFTGTTYRTDGTQSYTAASGQNFLVTGGATSFLTSGAGDTITFATGTILLSNGADLTVDATGNAAVSIVGIRGTSDEDVTLDAGTSTLTVGPIGSGDEINTVAITGTGGITLNGNITTSNLAGNTVTITGAVTLGGAVTIDTDNATNDGAVSFSSTITGSQNFSVTAGGADITVTGAIGTGGTALTQLTLTGNNIFIDNIGIAGTPGVNGITSVNAANQLTFTGIIYETNGTTTYTSTTLNFLVNNGSNDIAFTTSNDNLSFVTGALSLENNGDLTITVGTGALSMQGGIRGNSSEDVTLSATGGSVDVGVIGNLNEINTVDITGTGALGVTLRGNITTSNTAGNTVTITGPVTLGADVVIDTSANNGTVNFSSSVNAGQNLTVSAGGGDITITGNVGNTSALNALALNSTGTTTLGGTVAAASVTTNTGGTTRLNGNVTTSGVQTYNDNLEINADVTLQTTNSTVTFGGTVNSQTATDRDLSVSVGSGTISFGGPVGGSNDLGDFTFTTTGALTIGQSITATGTGIINTGGLLTLSGGTITVPTLTLNPSATGVSQTGGSLVVSGTLTMQGAGDFDLNGPTANNAGTLATSGATITSIDYRDSNALTLGVLQTSGNINILHDTGVLSIGGNITITGTGTFTEDAASTGSVTITGTRTIQTNGQNITFDTAITINDGFTLNLTTGGGGTAGTITFTTVNDQNATADTTLNLTAANFSYTGIGNSNKLSAASLTTGNTSGMNISSGTANANNLSFTTTSTNATANLTLGSALTADTITLNTQQTLALNENITATTGAGTLTITAKSVTQSGTKTLDVNNLVLESQNGTGDFTINSVTNIIDNVSTSGAGVAGNLTLVSAAGTTTLGSITTTNGGDLNVTHGTNILTISGTLSLAGSFTTIGSGTVNLQNNVTVAAGENINIAGALVVSGSRTLTSSGAGSVTVAGVTRTAGTDDLTINAGSGGINLNGSMGTGGNPFDVITLNTTGAITQGAFTINATTLIVTAAPDAGGDILTTNITNLSGTINGGNAFRVNNTGALTINAALNAGTSTLTLNAPGIGGAGLVSANQLELLGNGNVSLSTSVNTLAASIGAGTLSISNNQSFSVGTAGGTTGITTTNATATAVSLTAAGATSDLTLGAGISIGAGGTVSLSAGRSMDLGTNTNFAGRNLTIAKGVTTAAGTFSPTATTITADTLTVNGQGSYTMLTDITTLAGTLGGGAGTFTLTESNTLVISNFSAAGYTVNIIVTSGGLTGGTLTAGSLSVDSAGSVNLTTALGNFAATIGSGNNLTITNTGTLNITTVGSVSGITTAGGGDVTITSSNGVSQSLVAVNRIATDTLTINGTGNFILNNSSNAVGFLTTGAGSLAVTGGTSEIQITVSAAGITLLEIETTGTSGNLTVNTTGTVTVTGPLQLSGTFNQGGGGGVSLSGSIVGSNFNYSGPVTIAGNTTLTTTGNGSIVFGSTVDGLGGGGQTLTLNTTSGTGTVSFGDAVGGGVSLGDITINTNSAITLNQNMTSTGTITVNADVDDNGSGNTISHTAGTLTAQGVTFDPGAGNFNQTAGIIDMTGASKTLTLNSNQTGTFTINNAGNDIGTLAGTVNGSTTVISTSSLTVSNFNAGAGTVLLTTAGVTGGTLTAANLGITSSGSVNLNTTVGTFAANLTTAGTTLVINETNALTIGTVGTITGITALGNVSVTTNGGGALTVSQAISATISTVAIVDISLNTVGGGALVLSNTVTASNTGFPALSRITLAPTGGASGTGDLTANTLTLNGSGNYDIDTNVVTLTGTIGAGAGTVTIEELNALAISNFNATGKTVILTSTGLTGGTLTADRLQITSTGIVNLTTAINILEVSITGAGNTLFISNSGNLAIGGSGGLAGITTSGNQLTVITGGTMNVTETVNSGGANLILNSGALMTLAGNLTAGAGSITLNASSTGINQTAGAVTGFGLEITGSGSFILNLAGNDVDVIAVLIASDLTFRDSDALTVGGVGSTTGINTNNGNLRLNVGGLLTLVENVNVGTAMAIFDSTGGGGAIQSGGALTADNLLLLGGGAFTLTDASNDLATVAAQLAGGSGSRIFITSNGGDLVIGTVNGINGVATQGDRVEIRAPLGILTVNQNITVAGLGTGTATGIGQVVLNATLFVAGDLILEGTASGGGGGGGTITLPSQLPQNPNIIPLNLGGLGGVTTQLGGDLGSLGSLGLDPDIGTKDDLTANIENIKLGNLDELKEKIDQIMQGGGENAALRRSLEEVANSLEILQLANEALNGAGGVLNKLPEGDPLRAALKELIEEVQRDGTMVNSANQTLAEKVAGLVGGDRMDRLAEDALEGAIAGLRNANDKLKVAALVLLAATKNLQEGTVTKEQVEEFLALLKKVREEEARKLADLREKRDRMSEDARFAALQDISAKKEEKKSEEKATEPKPAPQP